MKVPKRKASSQRKEKRSGKSNADSPVPPKTTLPNAKWQELNIEPTLNDLRLNSKFTDIANFLITVRESLQKREALSAPTLHTLKELRTKASFEAKSAQDWQILLQAINVVFIQMERLNGQLIARSEDDHEPLMKITQKYFNRWKDVGGPIDFEKGFPQAEIDIFTELKEDLLALKEKIKTESELSKSLNIILDSISDGLELRTTKATKTEAERYSVITKALKANISAERYRRLWKKLKARGIISEAKDYKRVLNSVFLYAKTEPTSDAKDLHKLSDAELELLNSIMRSSATRHVISTDDARKKGKVEKEQERIDQIRQDLDSFQEASYMLPIFSKFLAYEQERLDLLLASVSLHHDGEAVKAAMLASNEKITALDAMVVQKSCGPYIYAAMKNIFHYPNIEIRSYPIQDLN